MNLKWFIVASRLFTSAMYRVCCENEVVVWILTSCVILIFVRITFRIPHMGKTEMWKNKKLLEYATEGNRIYLYLRITTRFEFFCMTDMIMEWIKYVNIHNLLYCVKKPRCSLYFVGILSRGKLPSSIFGRQNKLYKINVFLFF